MGTRGAGVKTWQGDTVGTWGDKWRCGDSGDVGMVTSGTWRCGTRWGHMVTWGQVTARPGGTTGWGHRGTPGVGTRRDRMGMEGTCRGPGAGDGGAVAMEDPGTSQGTHEGTRDPPPTSPQPCGAPAAAARVGPVPRGPGAGPRRDPHRAGPARRGNPAPGPGRKATWRGRARGSRGSEGVPGPERARRKRRRRRAGGSGDGPGGAGPGGANEGSGRGPAEPMNGRGWGMGGAGGGACDSQ